MDFIIAIFIFLVIGWIVLKLFGIVFHVGIFMLTLPIKLLGLALALILTPLILIPLGLFAGIVSLIALPFALIGPAVPVLLIALGIWALLKHN